MMNYFGKLSAFVALFIVSLNPVFALDGQDGQAIQGVIQNYTDSWNQKGGQGFADGFTDDASFVNIFGTITTGKTEIEARHVQILQNFLKDSQLEILDTDLREVQPGIVVALVKWKLTVNPLSSQSLRNKGNGVREGVFTQVFVNTDNTWLITASQNTVTRQKKNGVEKLHNCTRSKICLKCNGCSKRKGCGKR